MGRCSIDSKACDRDIEGDMEGTNIPTRAAIRRAMQSAFRGKPVTRVELFGSSARGEMSPDSDVDLLVTPSPEATGRDLFIMARTPKMPSEDQLIFSFAPTLKQ